MTTPGVPPLQLPCRRRRVWLTVVAVLVALIVADCAPAAPIVPVDPVQAAIAAGQEFLTDYVDDDGRVIRRDQGGDTVSEGQAYAMLIAAAVNDQQRFRTVWSWTRAHLLRPDGLLSWHWDEGHVVDLNSGSDADLDTSRALLLAGTRFTDPELTAAGLRLGAAVLASETTTVGTDLLPAGQGPPPVGSAIPGSGQTLTGGNWATATPAAVNPSYFSPRAEQLIGTASGNTRWAVVTRTHRALAWQLVGTGQLPPDWAQVSTAGSVTPAHGPAGEPPQFGLDAARMPIRMAESCDPADHALAAALFTRLNRPNAQVVGTYSLDGTSKVDWSHPVALVALAAAAEAAGRTDQARNALQAAADLVRRYPTYYGSAWVALGRITLGTDLLGTCP